MVDLNLKNIFSKLFFDKYKKNRQLTVWIITFFLIHY
jgi:hypothetical protein